MPVWCDSGTAGNTGIRTNEPDKLTDPYESSSGSSGNRKFTRRRYGLLGSHLQATTRRRPVIDLLLLSLTLAAADPASTGCVVPNVAASTVIAALPNKPVIADNYNLTGTTWVQVDLDPNGQIASASIAKSSGYATLDQAALEAARQSTFRPETQDCQQRPGSYLFEVDFPQ